MNLIDGVGVLGVGESPFAIGEGSEHAVGGELRHGQFLFLEALALFLDSLEHTVVQGIHVDDSVNE